MVNYYIPGFFGDISDVLVYFLLSEKQNNPEIFRDEVNIGAVFGSFPRTIWDGGRYRVENCGMDLYSMQQIAEDYEALEIPIRFTFTNCLITEKDLEDDYCNIILQVFNNRSNNNEILVNSDLLKRYIEENYPYYRIVSSTTKCNGIEDLRKELLDDSYYMVVADSSLNYNEKLFDLPNKDKLELLLNHRCADNCPRRRSHYNHVSKANLEHDCFSKFDCDITGRTFWECMKENKSFITREDLDDKFIPAGFHNFKFDGRGADYIDQVDAYIYYLIKPEYQNEVKNKLFKSILYR